MTQSFSLKLLLLATIMTMTFPYCSAKKSGDNYVRDACSVTQYPALCFHSLASIYGPRKQSPSGIARAAVSVTLAEAKRASSYIFSLTGRMRRRQRGALLDCIECFGDAVDELHKSLRELRSLDRKSFEWQMSNVQTWISAALTNEDTCLEGFAGSTGKAVELLNTTVENITHVTSNALALVNKLASSGIDNLTGH